MLTFDLEWKKLEKQENKSCARSKKDFNEPTFSRFATDKSPENGQKGVLFLLLEMVLWHGKDLLGFCLSLLVF